MVLATQFINCKLDGVINWMIELLKWPTFFTNGIKYIKTFDFDGTKYDVTWECKLPI